MKPEDNLGGYYRWDNSIYLQETELGEAKCLSISPEDRNLDPLYSGL